MATLHADLVRLQKAARYARFRKVDLHIHTPGVPWCWNQKVANDAPKAGDLTPKDVARALVASDLDVVAITDHDFVGWVSDVIRETRELARKQHRDITALPGVEVTTYDGVHLLGIFPVTKELEEIHQMLVRFGLRADGTTSERANEDWPCAKIAEGIRAQGGLVIAPHATNPRMGIWGGAKSEHHGKRIAWLRGGVARILACAPTQRTSLENAIKNAGIQGRFAYIRHSDAHTFDEIGVNATYIKLAEPTIEGLRQVIYEPDLRVSMDPPAAVNHPALLGVEINGGYFRSEVMSFSDQLNVLVGANYSGKSAIVDALRFAFDDDCFHDAAAQQHLLARVRGIMSPGFVRAWFRDAKGITYRVERSTVIEERRKANQSVLSAAVAPAVNRIEGNIDVPVDESPMEILHIDFYGQGSVGKVGEFEERHRELIDAMGDLSPKARALETSNSDVPPRGVIAKLLQNALDLQKAYLDRQAAEAELAEIPGLTEQRKKLEAQSKNPLLSSWSKWQDFQRATEALHEEIDQHRANSDADTLADGYLQELTTLPAPGKGLDRSADAARRAMDDFAKAIRTAALAFSKTFDVESKMLLRVLDKWSTAFEKQEELVRNKLHELNLANEAALARRISDVTGKIERIEKKRPHVEKLTERIAELTTQRTNLLDVLDASWAELREKRKAFVEKLNTATSHQIRMDYSPATDASRLRSRLDELISRHGTRSTLVQRREHQIDLLVRHYSARNLADDLVRGDTDRIIEQTGVTANTATFLAEMPLADRLNLALYVEDDAIAVTWRRDGDDDHSPLGALSPGERQLALLSLAFANQLSPIVIDQPEDELGQMLVTADLIDTVRAKKAERQFIVVTHNANVPVLGDAEGIFHMHNQREGDPPERRCTVKHAGSIECEPIKTALLGLEGGRESFEKRQLRYNLEAAPI